MKPNQLTEIPTHVCAHCGYQWQEMTLDDARHVLQAVQVNKQGPWCNLCHHLKFALIFAMNRGHTSVAPLKEILIRMKV